MFLFETVFHSNSKIFEDVPERKEGKANKETKGASDFRHQRDNIVVDHLIAVLLIFKFEDFLTSVLTETETEAYFRATPNVVESNWFC